MKTTTQNLKEGLQSRPEQLGTQRRGGIDHTKRHANRFLGTGKTKRNLDLYAVLDQPMVQAVLYRLMSGLLLPIIRCIDEWTTKPFSANSLRDGGVGRMGAATV